MGVAHFSWAQVTKGMQTPICVANLDTTKFLRHFADRDRSEETVA
jgi:hypothetical protein